MKTMCVCLLGTLLNLLPYAAYARESHTQVAPPGTLTVQATQGLLRLAQLALQHPALATQVAGGCAAKCVPSASSEVRGVYLPITEQSLAPLVKLAMQNTALLSQSAGDCQTTCEWDPIAQENVCNTHCDSDNSGPVDNTPDHTAPMSKWTAGQWIFFIIMVGVIAYLLWDVIATANAETSGPPPG